MPLFNAKVLAHLVAKAASTSVAVPTIPIVGSGERKGGPGSLTS